jgi:hypothetical protein
VSGFKIAHCPPTALGPPTALSRSPGEIIAAVILISVILLVMNQNH